MNVPSDVKQRLRAANFVMIHDGPDKTIFTRGDDEIAVKRSGFNPNSIYFTVNGSSPVYDIDAALARV